MFWALELEPGKVYKQKVEKSYHISMACLEPNKCTDSRYSTFMVKKDGTDFVLCNLQKDRIIQVQLDLMFGNGDEVAFSVVGGKNKVFLSGYVVDDDEDKMFDGSYSDLEESTLQQDVKKMLQGKRKIEASPVDTKHKKRKPSIEQSDDDSEESDNEEDGYEQDDDENEEGNDDDDDEEEEEGDEDEEESDSGSESDDEEESEEENTPTKVALAKSTDNAKKKTPNARQQINEKMQQKSPVMTPDSQVNGKTPKSKKKNKDNKTPGGDENAGTPKMQKTPDSSKEVTPQKMKLEGGVVAIDTKVGTGAPAKAGKKVAVYYTGRLQQNNKQFDSTTQGKGFVFQLGRGEVIKGWDIGVAGMKVGGKRKIIVPAPLAYGNKGSPPVIPPNANLVFEVELKNVY